MNVNVETIEKNVVKLSYELSAEMFEEEIQASYKKNVGRLNVPGFRKGKAPRKMVEKIYGEGVLFDDAINALFSKSYDDAVKEAGISPVSRPEIDVDGDIKSGSPVKFVVTVTVKPEVTLGDYKGIEIEKIEYTVSDEDIAKEINKKTEQGARIVPVEGRKTKTGDTVLIDFEGFVDGEAFEGGKAENFSLELGSGQFIPGFEDQLVDREIGDDVEVNVSFPSEYQAENLAGKPALFKVLIHGIKEKQIPEFNDDFAQDSSEFETADELRKSIEDKLNSELLEKIKLETENAVITKIVENAEVEVPDVMVEAQIDNVAKDFDMRLTYQGMNLESYLQYTGMDMEGFRAQFKEQAKAQVETSLVLEKIADTEGIVTTDEDYEAHLTQMAVQYKMEIEKMKTLLRPEDVDGIKNEIKITKTVDMLVNKAELK